MKFFTTAAAALVLTGICGAGNLVQNGDFAQGGNLWQSPQYTGGKKYHVFENGKLTVSGNQAGKYNAFVSLVQELPLLDPAQEYIISADVTANVPEIGKKYCWIKVRQANESNVTIAYSGFDVGLRNKNSKKYVAKFRPSGNAASFRLYVISANLSDSDQITVDNITLTPVNGKAAAGNAAAVENLVRNGDFETNSLAPWVSRVGKAQTAPFAIAPDGVLNINGDPANKYKAFLTLIQQLPPLQAGKKYQLSFRAKAGLSDVTKKSVAVQVRESDMDNITIVYDGVPQIALGKKDWQVYKVTFIPRVEADKFELYVRSTNLAQGDTVCVDDISIIPVK